MIGNGLLQLCVKLCRNINIRRLRQSVKISNAAVAEYVGIGLVLKTKRSSLALQLRQQVNNVKEDCEGASHEAQLS